MKDFTTVRLYDFANAFDLSHRGALKLAIHLDGIGLAIYDVLDDIMEKDDNIHFSLKVRKDFWEMVDG